MPKIDSHSPKSTNIGQKLTPRGPKSTFSGSKCSSKVPNRVSEAHNQPLEAKNLDIKSSPEGKKTTSRGVARCLKTNQRNKNDSKRLKINSQGP